MFGGAIGINPYRIYLVGILCSILYGFVDTKDSIKNPSFPCIGLRQSQAPAEDSEPCSYRIILLHSTVRMSRKSRQHAESADAI